MKQPSFSRICRLCALVLCAVLLAGLLTGCAAHVTKQQLLQAALGPAAVTLFPSSGQESALVRTDSGEDALPCYYDQSSGMFYYVCEDLNKVSDTEHDYTLRAFYYRDGTLRTRILATRTVFFNAAWQAFPVCRDGKGNAISDRDYEGFADRFFSTCTKTTLPLNGSASASPSQPAPAATPYPTPAPTPTPSWENYSGPAPVVTKNPTSESLSTGGTTWFIAHARNATRLTWQAVSPDGLVYTTAEAMALHPGLALENEANDTLAVRNVPFTLNGWGFQARFEGAGGIALSSVAYIYVADFVTAYQNVLNAYRAAYQAGSHTAQYAVSNGLSPMIAHSPHVGYAFKDLDKDGTPELLIAGLNTDDVARSTVYDVYALVSGVPKRLAVSTERDRFYLCTDNAILNSGSPDANHTYYFVYRFGNNRLTASEGYMSCFTGSKQDGYYYQTGSYSPEPRKGDLQLSESAFRSQVREREAMVFQLLYTQIA